MALTKIPSSLLDTSGGFDLQGNITLGDNEQILFGAGSDLEIYHDGSNSFIKDVGTGDLIIQGSNAIRLRSSTGENMAIFNADGAATLQYDNLTKLQTTSTGATVTGTLTVTGDLDITGDINSYNVTDLDVTDQTITLGAGQTEANSGGSGIIIDGSSASILWDETNDEWDINKNVRAESFSVGAGPTAELLFLSGAGHNGHGTTNTRSVASFNTTGQSAGVWFGGRTDETTGIIGTRTATGNLAFETYNSGWGERMRITYDGNVGIGTTSPQTDLNIVNSSGATLDINSNASAADSKILLHEGTSASPANGASIRYDGANNLFKIGVGSSVDTTRLTIARDTGNVGIGGTPDSSGRLLVQNGGTNQIVLTNNDSATTNLNMGNFAGAAYISQNYYYDSGHQADDNTKGAYEVFIGDDAYGINYHSAGAMGTRRRDFAITSAGNVGMGTNNPSFGSGSGLEIERAGIATLRFQNTSSGKSVEITQDSDFKIESMNSASDILLMPTANVGIGTTSPLSNNKLHVNGNVHIGNGEDYSSYAKLAVYDSVYQGDVALLIKNDRYNDSTATASLIFEHRTHGQQGHAAKIVCRRQGNYNETAGSKDAALDFYTAEGGSLARHMVLTRSGQFGVGNNASFDAYAHHVIQSDTTQKVLDLKQNNATGRVLGLQYIPNGPDDTTDYYMVCSDSNTNDMFIYSNGNVANKNNSYGSSSDIKIKQNISDANSQWNDIKALQFKNYKLKTDVARYGEDNADTLLGLIAQDVETAGMNGLVYESKDQDSDGNDLGTVTKGVKYSVLYLKAVKALQEAIVKIEDLEARIAELEG